MTQEAFQTRVLKQLDSLQQNHAAFETRVLSELDLVRQNQAAFELKVVKELNWLRRDVTYLRGRIVRLEKTVNSIKVEVKAAFKDILRLDRRLEIVERRSYSRR